MIRLISSIAAIALCATTVHAQNTAAIAKRQAVMKSFGIAVREPSGMVRGDIPLDIVKVRAALKSIQESAARAKTVFPDDSRAGDTNTLPAAFKNKADLFARFDKLAADAKSAESAIQDEASLKTQWSQVFSSCLSCHKDYVRRQ